LIKSIIERDATFDNSSDREVTVTTEIKHRPYYIAHQKLQIVARETFGVLLFQDGSSRHLEFESL